MKRRDEGHPSRFGGGPPPGSPSDRTGRKTPMPALINITVPVGTLLGWSGTPADVGTWGLTEAGTARDLIEAASRHPAPDGATRSPAQAARPSRTPAHPDPTPGSRPLSPAATAPPGRGRRSSTSSCPG
jgi:hypothetical protein